MIAAPATLHQARITIEKNVKMKLVKRKKTGDIILNGKPLAEVPPGPYLEIERRRVIKVAPNIDVETVRIGNEIERVMTIARQGLKLMKKIMSPKANDSEDKRHNLRLNLTDIGSYSY